MNRIIRRYYGWRMRRTEEAMERNYDFIQEVFDVFGTTASIEQYSSMLKGISATQDRSKDKLSRLQLKLSAT